jgi:hypothetical protein
MASSKATTVKEYLDELPAERRKAISAVRKTIRKHLPEGFKEGMQYGMIGYFIPLKRYPTTYNGQPLGIAALASQKNYMALYLMAVYGDPKLEKWFKSAFAKAGKKLDMGKSCVRFKSLDDLPLDVIGEVVSSVSVDDFIARYEAVKGRPHEKTTRMMAKKIARKSTKRAGSKK